MAHELVSVIIPVYNADKYIYETIKSVLQQSYQDFELVVINDGSTDRTDEIIANISDQRIIYHKTTNSGVSKARNTGLNLSKGEFVAFLDADDIWLKHNLKKKVEQLKKNKCVALVHSDGMVIDNESRALGSILKGKGGNIFQDILMWNGTCIPSPSSILMRRQIALEVNGFCEKLSTAADKYFFLSIARDYSIQRIPDITWHYRLHNGNMHKNIKMMELDELHIIKKIYRNGWYSNFLFMLKSISKTLKIIGASWIGDGKNYMRGIIFILISIIIFPPSIILIFKKSNENSLSK